MTRAIARIFQTVWLSVVLILLTAAGASAAEVASNNVIRAETPVPNDTLRAYLLLQDQMRATQLSVEKNRQDAEAAAARNAAAIAEQLKTLAESLNTQRSREIEAMQSTNRLLLVVVAAFAGFGFLSMLFTAWLQMRAVNKLTEFTAMLPARLSLVAPQFDPRLLSNAATAQANTQLFGALDRIEKRIVELESAAVEPAPPPAVEKPAPASVKGNGTTIQATEVPALLAKGQSLLSAEKPHEALACYDEILRAQPDHAEALVKKGTALELLRRDEDALQCYNRAIAADSSLTIAYLQKGGLFNRLERYQEALECYERALQTQDKARQTN